MIMNLSSLEFINMDDEELALKIFCKGIITKYPSIRIERINEKFVIVAINNKIIGRMFCKRSLRLMKQLRNVIENFEIIINKYFERNCD